MAGGPFLPIPHSTVEGIAWPALQGGMQAVMLATLEQLEHSQYLPEPELRARQFLQIGQLLRHVARAFPFYAPRLRAAGLDPARPIVEEAWSRLPILTREEAQAAGDALRNPKVPKAHGETVADTTTGSTGVPLKVLKTALTQFFWSVFTLREEHWHRRDFGAKYAAIRRDDRRPAGHQGVFATSQPTWGPPQSALYPTGPAALLDIRCTIAEQVAWLQREQPNYLLTFGLNLLFLARHCIAHGIALPSLRWVTSSGEVLTEETRAACRAAWGVEPIDVYSAIETGSIAIQCPEHPHMHVQSENVLVEVLDDDGRPCAPGQVGRVVVTTLHNFATPLLRYAIGDLAEVGPPCSCGRTLSVLTRVLGRTRDMLVLPSGERRFPFYGQKAFSDFPAIVQHQLAQVAPDAIEVRLVVRNPLTPAEEERLRAIILAGLGHPFRLTFAYPDAIPRAPGGKFVEFVNHIAPS